MAVRVGILYRVAGTMTVINIYAPTHWDICNSYGLIACQLARHLTALGCYVNAHSPGMVTMDNQPADVAAITAQPHKEAAGAVMMGWPNSFEGYHGSGRHRIALTMFESTKLPEGWTDALNAMDAVIVPSRFCKDVFLDCGVTTPITVAALGINDVYQPYERPQREVMTFLAFLDRGSRKGGDVAQAAFKLAFGDDPRYQLILKQRSPLKTRVDLFPVGNVRLLQRDMTEAELYELYCSVDVLINPNRGEGFGLLPREFAATGGISLTTAWGGTADELEQWGWPIDYTLRKAHWLGQPWLEGCELGDWAEPSAFDLAGTLRLIAQQRESFLTTAYQRAKSIRQLYSWQKFASQVHEVWLNSSLDA